MVKKIEKTTENLLVKKHRMITISLSKWVLVTRNKESKVQKANDLCITNTYTKSLQRRVSVQCNVVAVDIPWFSNHIISV